MEIVMKNVYYSFDHKHHNSYDSFVNEVTTYNDSIDKAHGWNPDQIVFDKPRIKLVYEAIWKNEDDWLEVIIEGENGNNIKMGEVLFQLNYKSGDFFKDQETFFEGLQETKSSDGIPTYFLLIGS